MVSVYCKTCGHWVDNDDATLIWHQAAVHGVTKPIGFDSWDEAQFLRRAMARLMENYYDRRRGDDGTAGVREPRRPKPPEPSVSVALDSRET